MCCRKCSIISGVLLLLIGVGYLLADLGYWTFWGLSWWTVAFLLAGIAYLAMSCCRGCQGCCGSCGDECAPHESEAHEEPVATVETKTVETKTVKARKK